MRLEDDMADYERPGPLRWLWYAFGGGLPQRYSAWVLHDTTCPTWILRHLVRALIMLAVPVLLVVFLLPTSAGIKALTAFTAGACGLMFMTVHIIETTERRLVRAGFVGGIGEATRHQRSSTSQRDANARRRERAALRSGRR